MQVSVSDYSPLQQERTSYQPPLPSCFAGGAARRVLVATPAVDPELRAWLPVTLPGASQPEVAFSATEGLATPSAPLRIGVVFCGRQCPGGHSVVTGLHDALQGLAPGSTLIGFVGGTLGLFEGKTITLTAQNLAPYRNQGGYHMLGRSVDKIHTAKEQAAALASATALSLDGLVLLGGTFTNTDAAHLAEYFAAQGSACRVVGVPATVDGDMKGPLVEATLGFDTACKITSQLMGNLETDCLSAKKYVYFVRVLGREAGHMALEVALASHPNVLILGEDCAERGLTLMDVVREVANAVGSRGDAGKNFAVVLLGEGLPHHIPELRCLLREIDGAFSQGASQPAAIEALLTPWSRAVLDYLPAAVRAQLFLERESNGRAQLSQISTERIILELVNAELAARKKAGVSRAKTGNGMGFFFGYQARSALPSNFDCALGGALGHTAAHLVAGGHTGYLATVRGCAGGVGACAGAWRPVGVPLSSLMLVPLAGGPCTALPAQSRALTPSGSSVELGGAAAAGSSAGSGSGSGSKEGSAAAPLSLRPTIHSLPVDVRGPAYRAWRAQAAAWATGDLYVNPGPIQFGGAVGNAASLTLELEGKA